LGSLFSLARVWTKAPGAVYRPLSLSRLWVEGRAFGKQPIPFHCVSLMFHAGSGVLLWFILRRLAVPGAWLGAALFVVHPVQVQSVVWIVQQPHVIGGLFFLLTIWLYLRWAQIRPPLPEALAGMEPEDEPSGRKYAIALLASVLAVLSDPAGISLPLVLLLLLWWKRGPVRRAQWRRLLPFFGVALASILADILLPHPAQSSTVATPMLSMLQRILIAGRAAGVYAIDAVRLYSSQFIHPLWNAAPDAWNVLPILLIAAIAVVAWAGRRRWGATPIACLLVFIALLGPWLAIRFAQAAPAVYVSDSQQYLAAIVPLALIAAGLSGLAMWLSSSMSVRTARAIVGGLAICLLGVFAVIQGRTYADVDAAFKTALAQDPSNSVARAQYAIWLLHYDPAQGAVVLDGAGHSASADISLLDARARVNLALDDRDDAVSNYMSAQRLAPDQPDIRLGLAEACDAAGVQAMADGRREDASEDFNDALAAYDSARQLNASEEVVRDGIGKVMLHEGRLTESIDQFDSALALDSGCVSARIHKAQALFNAGMLGESEKISDAMTELHDVMRLDPTNSEAYRAAGDMQVRLKNYLAAEKDYRAALLFQPGAWQVWTDLGFAQSSQDRYQEALRSFERALALESDAPDALRGKQLAKSQLAMGNQKS
jgi:tetratricopeptide (TPR) repeat protein